MVIEIVVDGAFELGERRESASPNALSCDLGEEPLDEVGPGGAGRREMHLEAGVLLEPPFTSGVLSVE